MNCNCKFNPVSDIRKTDQRGFVDLAKSVASGLVPSNLESNVGQFNNIERFEDIGQKPKDIFDVYRSMAALDAQTSKAKNIKNVKSSSETTSEKTE